MDPDPTDMTDEQAVELLNLLNLYVGLPDSTDDVGNLTISDLAADLLMSLPDASGVDALHVRLNQ